MKYNELFKKKYENWSQLEKAIEKLPTTYEKGEVFEQFIFAYLSLNKQLYQIEEIYRTAQIPPKYLEKYKIERKDSGIDGLFILNNKKVAAYQVKFRSSRKKPSYDELAKFWVEAQHTDLNYTIANCYSITDLSKKQSKHLQILVEDFDSLDTDFFESLFVLTNNITANERIKHKPYKFQENIINDTLKGFEHSNRGKIIAACGTGKTLTSLWITEKLGVNTVLFLAPSIALVRQTLNVWANQSNNPFSYLVVCSDKSISINEDDGDIALSELNVPVTTNTNEISDFLLESKETPKYIFSTYQSLPVISEVFDGIDKFKFDLIIFDEAHRTAGAKFSSLFSLALDDNNIPSSKRLFMTATQRLLKPRLKKIAEENDRLVFSMDDENIYGKLFHSYNFGDAIRDKIISDYEIVVAGINESELKDWISKNKDIEVNDLENISYTTAQTLFTQIVLAKSLQSFPINKVISFHSSVHNAKVFSGEIGNGNNLKKIVQKINTSICDDDILIDHINGTMSTGLRSEKLDLFEAYKYGVISNSRCLTEGIDVPIIDSIYFVESKNSIIDIVQACGRALRKPRNIKDKTAFFIIPILIPENSNPTDIVNLESFDMVYTVIQALRDQDNRLDEWVNEINNNVVKGKFAKYKTTNKNPVKFFLPKNINLDDFADKLYLKIATVNANPSTNEYNLPKIYGKNDRKSGYKRIFKTLGDYSFSSYFSSLVEPTIDIFKKSNKFSIASKDLKINNNNVSHTFRLGLISMNGKNYELTPLGKDYLDGKITNEELFKRQMLRYSTYLEDGEDSRMLFPYRTCLKIIEKTKSINLFEFAFAINTLYDSSSESIDSAVDSIFLLRDKYPNLSLVNEANRISVLNELNETFSSQYTLNDIWTKRTTLYNQFGYFRNHLSIFEDFIVIKNQSIVLDNDKISTLHKVISIDNRLEYEKNHKNIISKYISSFLNIMIFTL